MLFQLALLYVSTLASIALATTDGEDVPIPVVRRNPHGLNALAERTHRYFGCAFDVNRMVDVNYTQLVLSQFGRITPENSLKWEITEPERGVFNFTDGDIVVETVLKNHMSFRAHTLVWHSQLPDWVTAGNFSKETLIEIMQDHIKGVVGHYKGIPNTWDVVNEALNEDGTMRSTVFYDTIGLEFVDIAFHTARAADPSASLAINEYNIDGTGNKSTGMINLVKSAKARGVPIDQIGAQAHLVVGTVPTDLKENWQSFTDLGVVVAITELDIRMDTPATAANLTQQALDYQSVVSACVAVPKCVGITVWGASDKYSWVPDTFPGEGAPLPWDDNLEPKPAYNATVKALEA